MSEDNDVIERLQQCHTVTSDGVKRALLTEDVALEIIRRAEAGEDALELLQQHIIESEADNISDAVN